MRRCRTRSREHPVRSYDVESVSTTNELVMFTVPASVPPGIYRLQLLASGMEDGEPCAGISTYRHTGHPITQQVTITPAT